MRRNELKIRKTRLWSALLFGMLTSMGILMTGCGTFHTDVNEEINVSDPGVSVPEMPDTSEPADLSLKNPENAGAEFTPELPENSAQGDLPDASAAELEEKEVIDPAGMTLETRVHTPEGYTRTVAEEDSLTQFLRSYPMKEAGAPVLLYDGREKGDQSAHAAVFDLPIENQDLQQCADSVMRVYAEYFLQTGQYERIAFHFTNGFLAPYSKWRDGQRIKVDGNTVSWVPSGGYDDSYECFQGYMKMIFSYAGTLSMDSEATPIGTEEIRAGDVFLHGGSPGHVVLVVDVCENDAGNKAFLLAQGYMPAQQFHLLKNPAHENDPWYYVNELTDPLHTPEYTFSMDSLKRLQY